MFATENDLAYYNQKFCEIGYQMQPSLKGIIDHGALHHNDNQWPIL